MILSRLEEALVGAYQKQRVNDFQVAVTFFFVRIYRIARANFERHWPLKVAGSGREAQAATAGNNWQWAGFPRLPALFEHYGRASSAYMAYVSLRNLILLDHLQWLIKLDKPAHCYLIGYLQFHPALARDFATILALCHLAWRGFQALVRRPFFLPMFLFLLFADRDLELFERQLARNEAAADFRSSAAHSPERPSDANRDPVYHLFRRVLCYKVEYRDHISYRLRPNRTAEARRALRKRLAQCTLYGGALFVMLALVLTAVILSYELNDRAYLARYPQCDQQLELAGARNALGAWSYSARPHELLSLAADVLENLVIWVDSGVALILLWTTIYMLHYDTHLHWLELDAKLRRVQLRVRADQLERARDGLKGGGHDDEFQSATEPDWGRRQQGVWRGSPRIGVTAAATSGGGSPADFEQPPTELKEAVRDLQAHFLDFFQQIGEIDLLISDIISATVLIWLSAFSVVGRRALRFYLQDGSQLQLALSTALLFCFSLLVVTVGTFAILELHRNCLRSHSTLCSLVAHDRSRFKLRLIKLLEFYTVKKRSTYTIFQQYPYTKTTYLSIFGWSLSCLFIFDSLARR